MKKLVIIAAALFVGIELLVWFAPRLAKSPAPGSGGLHIDEDQIGIRGSDYDLLAKLETILESKNDNDPRLDKDFNGMTAGQKKLFRRKYASLAPELRNERGTIIYLLGKNLTDSNDWSFLRDVAAEPPCLSLSDCSKRGTGPSGLGDDVTLAYPPLVALKQAQKALEKDPSSIQARRVIEAGLNSKTPAVMHLAAKIALISASKNAAPAKSVSHQ